MSHRNNRTITPTRQSSNSVHSSPHSVHSSRWEEAADEIVSHQKSWENVDDEQEDYDDSGWLDRKTKKVQNDTFETSKRALQKVEMAQTMAQASLAKLGAQTEQLDKVDRRLQETEHHVKISEVKTDRLKELNRFFMIPAFGNKAKKRREEELARQLELKKEATMQQQIREQDTKDRIERRQFNGQHMSRGSSAFGNNHSYSTPAGLERDDVEKGIDTNLNQISSGLSRLKMMGRSMNDELTTQSSQLDNIQDRADSSHDRVQRLGNRMEQMSRGRK